ncbi:hypothetical protein P154DRAFT_305058 [Amniculicola lignicola CBS 123094]|uniref:Uncharacterized protein n=1 Tax=Amniculicola lignicola CBS 123094 TaxID=1392246 RepID=A0A6A5W4U0_9PLEO|nr:hypothetical protein P154DRAFT_305058 [Amniculicola lignicola CBS 123094]
MTPPSKNKSQPLPNHARRAATSNNKKVRSFFQQVQPTFSISQPTPTLEFIDHSNPNRNLIVRKNAREWVNRKKGIPTQERQGSNDRSKSNTPSPESTQLTRRRTISPALNVFDVGTGRMDPFETLPDVGRKIDHILEYFLTSCPEELPGCDDPYTWQPQAAIVPQRENSILGFMTADRVSFVLWLHATTTIRDGIVGQWDSEESQWYYRQALLAVREASEGNMGNYSDNFMCSLAAFSACANYSGQYKAAELHRDFMVKSVTLKGDGDLMRGFLKYKPYTKKSLIWCELHVAAQIPSLPKFPYYPPMPISLPESLLKEASRLTQATLSNLPTLSPPLLNVLHLLHQLSLSQSEVEKSFSRKWPGRTKIDPRIIREMYDAEYTLLQVLALQQEPVHHFSAFEVVWSEACQMFLWTASRQLPPEMKMCDLFVERLQRALVPLLVKEEAIEPQWPIRLEEIPDMSPDSGPSLTEETTPASTLPEETEPLGSTGDSIYPPDQCLKTEQHSTKHDLALIWPLFLGAVVSGVGSRPEHVWFKEHFQEQMRKIGTIHDSRDLRRVLKLFPFTEAFCGLGIPRIELLFDGSLYA